LLRQGLSRRAIATDRSPPQHYMPRTGRNEAEGNKIGYDVGKAQRWTAFRRDRLIKPFVSFRLTNGLSVNSREVGNSSLESGTDSGWLIENGAQVRVCAQTIYDWIYTHRPDLRKYLHCTKGKYRRTRGAKIRLEGRKKSCQATNRPAPEHINNRKDMAIGRATRSSEPATVATSPPSSSVKAAISWRLN